MGTPGRALAPALVGLIVGAVAVPAAAAPSREDIDLAVRSLGGEHDRATEAVYVLRAGGARAARAIDRSWVTLSPLAQHRAVEALRGLAASHDDAVSALVRAARSEDERLRSRSLLVLGKAGTRGRGGLVSLLSDPVVGDRAASILARAAPDFAIRPLLDATVADGGADRRGLRDALTVAVQRSSRPAPVLQAWLRADPSPTAVGSTALALADTEAHAEVLRSFIEYAAPRADDFETRWRLLQAAGAAAASDTVDRWLDAELRAEDAWMIRRSAVEALTARGARARTRVALEDPYPRVRSTAAASLAGDADSLVARATLARKDVWPFVRAAAVVSLRSEADALPVIVATVDDPMSVVRGAAIDTLTPATHDEGWDRIRGRLARADEWPRVTTAAIEYAIAHCRTDAAEPLFRVVLRAGSRQPTTDDLNAAARAIEALRILGTPESKAALARLREASEVPPTLKTALHRPLPNEGACATSGP